MLGYRKPKNISLLIYLVPECEISVSFNLDKHLICLNRKKNHSQRLKKNWISSLNLKIGNDMLIVSYIWLERLFTKDVRTLKRDNR